MPRKRRRDSTEVSCVIKYLMFGFNVLFWVSGGFQISVLWICDFGTRWCCSQCVSSLNLNRSVPKFCIRSNENDPDHCVELHTGEHIWWGSPTTPQSLFTIQSWLGFPLSDGTSLAIFYPNCGLQTIRKCIWNCLRSTDTKLIFISRPQFEFM